MMGGDSVSSAILRESGGASRPPLGGRAEKDETAQCGVHAHPESVTSALAQFSLFSGLDGQAQCRIAACVHVHTYAAGQIIASTGEPIQGAYLVTKGRTRVYRLSPQGRELTLNYVGPGGSLNLGPVFDGGLSLATVEAVTDTIVYAIPCNQFREIVRDYPEIAAAVLESLADSERSLSELAESLGLYPVRARLARFLVSSTSDGTRLSMPWTQHEIAAYLGTVRDVIGRMLRSFSREGLIRWEKGRLVVTDWAGVRDEAMAELS
jgi:CRP-like cAMP-binding protein